MFFISMVVLGTISARLLKLEFFPELDAPFLLVNIPYPGSSPKEVERQILRPIEAALAPISGIKTIGYSPPHAEVAELVDAVDSKSTALKSVWVRFPPSAPNLAFKRTRESAKALSFQRLRAFLMSGLRHSDSDEPMRIATLEASKPQGKNRTSPEKNCQRQKYLVAFCQRLRFYGFSTRNGYEKFRLDIDGCNHAACERILARSKRRTGVRHDIRNGRAAHDCL
jgi:hypothetical protein